jgi:hypothetical protein
MGGVNITHGNSRIAQEILVETLKKEIASET